MLDPVEILDLQHCRKQDPMWAEKKAGHYLADAAACDARVAEAQAAGANEYGASMIAMAARYRARAKILMGEEL